MSTAIEQSRAEAINKLHAEMTGHMTMAVKKAIEIGRLLTEQKKQLSHGEWIPWVESNLTFGKDMAAKYMKVFRNAERVPLFEVTSLRQAVALLADPKDPPPEKEAAADPGVWETEKDIVYQTDPEQERKLQEISDRAAQAEARLSETENRLKAVQQSFDEADRKLELQKTELERLRKLDADKKRVEETLARIQELEKRKTELFQDAESTKVVHAVLVRSREFFTRECMQIPALKLRPESVRAMKRDFEGLVELVDNWLDAVRSRFLER